MLFIFFSTKESNCYQVQICHYWYVAACSLVGNVSDFKVISLPEPLVLPFIKAVPLISISFTP